MTFLKQNWFKITILLAVAFIAWILYQALVVEPRIERKLERERAEKQQEFKAEQEKKEYISKRKMECYEMYKEQRKQYSNLTNYGYVETYNIDGTPDHRDDTCEMIYKNPETETYFRKYR